MPNIATVIKEETIRIARKEIKAALTPLKKQNADLKRTNADLKRRISQLEQDCKKLLNNAGKQQKETEVASSDDDDKARITAKMVKSIRERLGLSPGDFGKLVGVSRLTVYQWEKKQGRLNFRGDSKARIVEVRGMKKAEAVKKLEG